jgi:hypothetical protein
VPEARLFSFGGRGKIRKAVDCFKKSEECSVHFKGGCNYLVSFLNFGQAQKVSICFSYIEPGLIITTNNSQSFKLPQAEQLVKAVYFE